MNMKARKSLSKQQPQIDINDTNQNVDFDATATTFLDFSESNPFGDVT